jgi:uncharacterized membrane protein YeaQ/YmgE (transglycosylase-associated protein family)
MFGLCSWIVFGFLAGLVGRAIMPGTQKMGFIATTLLGIAGAFVGGFLSSLFFHRGGYGLFEPSGFIGAVIGSIVLLVIAGAVSRR